MRFFVYVAVCLQILIVNCEEKQDNKGLSADSSISSGLSGTKESVLVIDVRTEREYSAGHIEGAINIPHTEIANKIENYTTDKNQKILLYCLSGMRSGQALKILTGLGYTNVENIGGYEDAKARLE